MIKQLQRNLTLLVLLVTIEAQAEDTVSFNRDIRQILTNHCYQCHGPDEEQRKADLRLDKFEAATALRMGTAAIIPGTPNKSGLIERIQSNDDDLRMPPASLKKDLTDDQIELLRRWISQGAEYEEHWSFNAPIRPKLPLHQRTEWGNNAIDKFVLRQMRVRGLEPNTTAEKEILIRRVTLDLTGLPPTIAEIDAFLTDNSPEAYETLVDRLINSPGYGERMAVAWMDAARYGDSSVFHADGPRDMWAWRDWVIRSFNSNKSYKDFTIEQIAGDLIPDASVDQRVASGFNRNHGTTDEGGAIAEEYRVEYIVDRIKTTSTVWLGMTLECAQCHDHKYDPFSQEEYYQLYAYFNQASDKGMQSRRGNEAPVVQVPNLRKAAQLPSANKKLALLNEALETYKSSTTDAYRVWLDKKTIEAAEGPMIPEGRYAFIDFLEQKDRQVSTGTTPPTLGSYNGNNKWTSGSDGHAIELDGKSHIDFGSEFGNFEGTDSFSFGASIKPPNNSSGAILSRMKDSNSFKGYDFLLSNGSIEVHIVHRWPDNAIKISTKNKVSPDKHQHVMVTYDGSQKARGLTIYFDGVSQELTVQQDSLSKGIKAETSFKVGKRDSSLFYRGEINSISIYRRALGAEEVKLDAGQHAITPILKKSKKDRTLEEQQVLLQRFYSQDKMFADHTTSITNQQKVIDELKKPLTSVMVMGDVTTVRPTFILERGNYASPQKDKEVMPAIPKVLQLGIAGLSPNRLGLAQWITDDRHPLTGRVTVNRIWQMFFGAGIVKTTGDFGSQGDSPSHPELLDWLAVEFLESGWDLKHLVRLMVTSETYRQSSHASAEVKTIDPLNRFYSHGPRFRLQAEFIRDSALAAGGILTNRMGGPGVKPYQPAGLWNEVSLSGNVRFTQDKGANNYRRSMYTYWKRSAPAPAMTIFDVPSREKCVVQRPRTNTPLQALVTLNDPQYLEAARALGHRMHGVSDEINSQISYGYRLATGRSADAATIALLRHYYEQELDRFSSDKAAADKLLQIGEYPSDASIPNEIQAALTLLSNLLLNLDAAITRG
ncbi:MAG: DUF1553 domain-containing protein [Planctomycetaceae bacterium]|nr:DUF1553 domain-containing protein [Planctomycetaceae bacterium]